MGIANLAMLTGNIGRPGVGVNPLRGQNNVQGSCDMGSFPHELPGYRPVSDNQVRGIFEQAWGVEIDPEPGLRINNMLDAAVAGQYKGLYVQGEDIAQSDPNTQHVEAALKNLDCLIVHDLFLNETAKYATVFLPGSSFLEKNGTFTNAERRISPVRKVMPPLAGLEDWQVTQGLCNALGFEMDYQHPREILDEIARLTPTFTDVSWARLLKEGSIQWPCNSESPDGTPIMHTIDFPHGKGQFKVTEYVPTDEKVTRRFPLLLTTGRILSQYNVGAQTRRTKNTVWHTEDCLEIHPVDAQDRGIVDGHRVKIHSRAGITHLRALLTERMQPGVAYATFHHPESGVNVVTTDNSDWATNCPEYKVTAVQISKVMLDQNNSAWQREFEVIEQQQTELAHLETQQEH
jgi:formate dehydrogenase major subunit